MKKRGLSPIIATVLIILLTIVAVAVIAGFIVPFVKNNLYQSTECLNYRSYFEFREIFESGGNNYRYNCYQNGMNGFSIENKGSENNDGAILGFEIVFIRNDGTSKKIEISDGTSSAELKTLDGNFGEILEIPKSGEIITYVYNAGENFNSMEVYPLLESGRVCEMTDSIKLLMCGAGISLDGGGGPPVL